jgi:methionyl-tRNA formyltransferase
MQKIPPRPGIIFFGTPHFAVPSLKALLQSKHRVLSVVTQPDRPRGRGRKPAPSPVKQVAADYGIEILQPEKISEPGFGRLIREKNPDFLIVIAFGGILPPRLLACPRWGALNIHASLLPKYRGAAPIHWAVLQNEEMSGLTAVQMDAGLDSGPLLKQRAVSIGPEETAGELHDRLALLAGDFLLEVLADLAAGRIVPVPQEHAAATYASKIDRRMALVDWTLPASEISARLRGLDPWPGAFTTHRNRRIKLFGPRVRNTRRSDAVPGRVAGHTADALEVETGRGLIEIRELQLPGRRRLKAPDFLRGFPLERGTILGS